MPLLANLPYATGELEPSLVQLELEAENKTIDSILQQEGGDQDSGYEDFDAANEETEESDTEGSIIHRRRPKKAGKAPAVPQRSDKRASKILENVLIELRNLDGSVPGKDSGKQSVVSDPHELYLSSEEDASFSDDYEDSESLIDFAASPTEDGEECTPASRASSCRSQEDTARVVSFTLVTRPQIIQINIPPTAAQKRRHSMNLETLTASQAYSTPPSNTRRPAPLELYSTSIHRLSISSTSASSTHHSNRSLTSLPPRTSSKLSSLMTNVKNSFVASDDFPSNNPQVEEEDEQERPITPKTPTTIVAAAWKRTTSRGLTKSRKSSIPTLLSAYTLGSTHRDSRLATVLAAEKTKNVEEEGKEVPQKSGEEEVSYEDIVKTAGEVMRQPPSNPKTETKMTISSKMSFGMVLALSRQKTAKARVDRHKG
jgi:hypothetical protein